MKLTSNRIRTLACPAGKRDILVFDDEQRGLGVRVTAGGGKTYLAQYSFEGRKHRVPIGSCGAIPLAEARVAARAIMGDVARGINVAATRKKAASEARKRSFTLAALIDDWRVLHLANRRPHYAADAVRTLRRVFAHDLDMPATDLDRATIVKALDAMTRRGRPMMATQTVAYGRACFAWAMKRGTVAVNPFVSMPTAPAVKRERVLTDDELATIWRATGEPGPFNAIVRMLILTGARCNEVAAMQWAEVADDILDPPGRAHKDRANTRCSAIRASARFAARLATIQRVGFSGAARTIQRLRARKGGARSPLRRSGLASTRYPQNRGNRAATAWGPPRSHGSRIGAHGRQPGRYRRRVSTPRLRGGTAGGA